MDFFPQIWLNRLRDWTQLLSPHLCIFCEAPAPLDSNPAVCEACADIGWLDPRCKRCQRSCHPHELNQSRCYRCKSIHYPFKSFKSLGPYNAALRKAILRAKFYQDPLALRFIRHSCLNLKLPEIEPTLWCYIPSHKKRLKERRTKLQHIPHFFEALAKRHQQNFVALLTKKFQAKPQIELNEKERRKGLDESLDYCGPTPVPKNVFLFDDVWSTGTTLSSACRVLKSHGVQNIYVFTLAFNDLGVNVPDKTPNSLERQL